MDSFSLALKLPEFIGREKLVESIKEAIKTGRKALIIVGEGGVGKTFVLEKIGERLKEELEKDDALRKAIGDRELMFPDIIDFYNVEFHTEKLLAAFILDGIARLIQEKDRDLADKISNLADRIENSDIPERDYKKQFESIFKDLNTKYFLVFRFDTMEVLEYGEDDQEVLEECEVPQELPIPALKFLKEIFAQCDHGFAIFAGRPTERTYPEEKVNFLYQRLAEGYGSKVVEFNRKPYFEFGGFSKDEAKEYIEGVIRAVNNLPDYQKNKPQFDKALNKIEEQILNSHEGFEKLYILTDGRPIYIALTLEWLVRGLPLSELSQGLDEIERNLQWIRQKYEERLIEHIKDLDTPLPIIVRYAALFRKGFTPEMMKELLKKELLKKKEPDLSEKEIDKALKEFEKLSFVKSPHLIREEKRFFLHDEMYHLVEKYIWKKEFPSLSKPKSVAKFISDEIYGNEKKGDNEKKGLIGKVFNEIAQKSDQFREWVSLRRKAESLWTEKLYYELYADPMSGYYLYDILEVIALSQRRGEWDDLLRSELIRFVRINASRTDMQGKLLKNGRIHPDINKDCKIRWLRRFHVKNLKGTDEIIRIAWKIFDKHKQEYPPLWKARFHVLMGSLLREKGYYTEEQTPAEQRSNALKQFEFALKKINEVKRQIEEEHGVKFYKLPDTEQIENNELRYKVWMARHYEATTKLHMGMLYRALGENKKSLINYEEAREIFQRNGEEFSVVRSLNNQAYVEARMGRFDEAYDHIEKVLKKRKELGDFNGYILSLSVKSFIDDRMGNYAEALETAREAKRIARLIFPSRVTAPYLYASLYEARALRHSARSRADRPELGKRYLEDALGSLQEVEENRESLEPFYQWELYNELGQVYLLKACLEGTTRKDEFMESLNKAEKYFEEADKIATKHGLINEIMDNCDDWAYLYITKLERYEEIKDIEDKTPDELYKKAVELLDKGRGQIEVGEKIYLKCKQEDVPISKGNTVARYYEAFYWLASLYFTRAQLISKFAHKCDSRNEESCKKEVVKYLFRSAVFHDLYTDEAVTRKMDTLTWLEDELKGYGSTLKVEELLREIVRDLKEYIGIGVKIDVSDSEFWVDKKHNYVVLPLSKPVERWDDAITCLKQFEEFINSYVKSEHKNLLKKLPIWSKVSQWYPRIDIIKLVEDGERENNQDIKQREA